MKIKKRLKEISLRRVNSIPAVPLKLRQTTAVPSGSSKPYPCNGGTRENLRKILRHSGSEVMGLMAFGYRLAPTGDSL